LPLSGLKNHIPQSGHSTISQSRSEPGSPELNTIKLPVKYVSGSGSQYSRTPPQSKSGIGLSKAFILGANANPMKRSTTTTAKPFLNISFPQYF